MILKNKGMYLETVINNSIFNLKEDEGFIYKMPLNSNIIAIDKNIVTSKLNKNYFCDYIGLYKGVYLEFEAKETEKDFFNLANIKNHQLNKLKLVDQNKGLAFVLIYFHNYEKLYLLHIKEILNFIFKKIPYKYFQENCFEINCSGIDFDFNNIFSHLVNYT